MRQEIPFGKKEASALLCATELGVGSLVHSFHLPLAGHLLSLNQGLICSQLSRNPQNRIETARALYETSNGAALLKCLTPIGNTLGPMLSIVMQGSLFALGILLLGKNLLGRLLGFALLSLWAFVQPLLTYGVLFGPQLFHDLTAVFAHFSKMISSDPKAWIKILLGLVLFKVLVAWSLEFSLGLEGFQRFWMTVSRRMAALKAQPAMKKPSLKKSFLSPAFLCCLVLTLGFAYCAKASPGILLWTAFRPFALVYALYLISGLVTGRRKKVGAGLESINLQ